MRSALPVMVASLLLVAAAKMQAQSTLYPELRPIDEASQQADFLAFRARLQDAMTRRDAAAVLSIVHADIRNTFGDDNGRDAFVRLWQPDDPDSELWTALGTLLALGGTFEPDGAFVAPYTFSRWPNHLDAFEHAAIVGTNVRVRATPTTRSAILTTLSYAVLPIVYDERVRAEGWTTVRLRGNRTGFIFSRYVRSPIDYRAIFRRVDGRWMMVTFIAGD